MVFDTDILVCLLSVQTCLRTGPRCPLMRGPGRWTTDQLRDLAWSARPPDFEGLSVAEEDLGAGELPVPEVQ